MKQVMEVGQTKTLTIFSGRGKIESYSVIIVELWAAVARVQIIGGGMIRVCVSQLSN